VIVTEEGAVVGSVDRAQLEELEKESKAAEPEATEPEVKPSKALSKDELVTLAESAGLGTREELEQFTKQDLVDELKAHEEG
jgi:predicted Zn-dependent peptidase